MCIYRLRWRANILPPGGSGIGPLLRIHAPAALVHPCTAQYVFPAAKRSIDPRSGIERRHHVSDQAVQRAMRV